MSVLGTDGVLASSLPTAKCGHRRHRCGPGENCALLPETHPCRMAPRPPSRRSSGNFSLRPMCIMCKIGLSPAVASEPSRLSTEHRSSAFRRPTAKRAILPETRQCRASMHATLAERGRGRLLSEGALHNVQNSPAGRGGVERRELCNPSRNCANPATSLPKKPANLYHNVSKVPRWGSSHEPRGVAEAGGMLMPNSPSPYFSCERDPIIPEIHRFEPLRTGPWKSGSRPGSAEVLAPPPGRMRVLAGSGGSARPSLHPRLISTGLRAGCTAPSAPFPSFLGQRSFSRRRGGRGR